MSCAKPPKPVRYHSQDSNGGLQGDGNVSKESWHVVGVLAAMKYP
jgi:hypothetical protein